MRMGAAKSRASSRTVAAPAPAPVSTPSLPSSSPRDNALKFMVESRLFWGMLILKLILGSVLASHYLRVLFTPFLNYFVESHFANPWEYFYQVARVDAFPYPPVMLFVLAIPRILFAPFLAAGTDTVTALHLLVMRLPLLASDLLAFFILLKWFPTRQNRVLALYWCSPIAIYVSYCHGQLDIIPTTLFLLSLYLVHHKRFTLGMVVYALAAASKSHLFAAFPLILIYTHQEKKLEGTLRAVAAGLGTYLAVVGPFLFSPAFRDMVFGTSETLRLYVLAVPFGGQGTSLLVAPAAVLILWFRFAAYPKWNWDLFMQYLGLLFCVFVLLIPPTPGYFLWSLPFVIFFLCRSAQARTSLYVCYAVSYLLFYLSGNVDELARVIPLLKAYRLGATESNILFTLMQTSLLVMTLGMYLFGVRSNAVYSLRTKPVMIGLAGDSGAGKDTFVHHLTELLGESRVTVTSGDDYHRWPRGHSKWKDYTHLDVRGNNLYKEQEHALSLREGKMVVRSHYDHTTGEFTRELPVDPKGYLVFSGLHSLSLQSMRSLYDLKIFLDPDESLRRHWKVHRDADERKYTPEQVLETLSRRQKDREKFILPQREHADIVVRLIPVGDLEKDSSLKLEVRASNSYDLLTLAEALEGVPTLSVEHDPFVDSSWQLLKVAGWVGADKLLSLCHDMVPNLDEIATRPHFRHGVEGCVQLVFLVCLSQQLLIDVKKQP